MTIYLDQKKMVKHYINVFNVAKYHARIKSNYV